MPVAVAAWSLRFGLVLLLFSASDPVRMAAAVALLSVQLPVQRAVLAWDRSQRRQTGSR